MKEKSIKQKLLRSERRKMILDLFGNQCAQCKSQVNLEFNHINRKNKKDVIANLLSSSLKTLNEEIAKCELLCRNCHKKFTANQWKNKEITPWNKGISKDFVHGTARTYTRLGCRCKLCKIAKKLYREKKIQINEAINPNKLT